MDRVLNEALRIISGAASGTSVEALQHYLGFSNMKDRYKMQQAREYTRAVTVISHPLHSVLDQDRGDVRLKTVVPWTITAKTTVKTVVETENIRADPWSRYNDNILKVDKIGDRSWRERGHAINQAEIMEYLETEAPTMIVATDGSIRGNITSWGGAVWRDKDIIYEWCTGKRGRTSSFRAETEAFEDALHWIATNCTAEDRVIILTDSKSLVTRLEGGKIRDNWKQVLS